MINQAENYSLFGNNTFRIDGSCRTWIDYTSEQDLFQLRHLLRSNKFFSIGEGSNVLLPPHYDGIVLHSSILDMDISFDSDNNMYVKAGAGLRLDEVIDHCCRAGRWGFENLAGIPGGVAASVVQNVGAYGVEIESLVHGVECFDVENNCIIELSPADCGFQYRNTMFNINKRRYIITHVTYRLDADARPRLEYGDLSTIMAKYASPTPANVRDEIIALRDSKLPSVNLIGSAGSFFKNPYTDKSRVEGTDMPFYPISENTVKVPAAWLIEQCGFKGQVFGNVGVWGKQPLVLVNATGRATTQEILEVAAKIIQAVDNRFGIKLELEVEIV